LFRFLTLKESAMTQQLTARGLAPTSVHAAIARFFATHVPDVAYQAGDEDMELLTGVLDSLAIVNLTTFLANELAVAVADEDFTEENFATTGAVVRFVVNKSAQVA
jgi:acyl carrier protein